ncbi:hypothetical protein [Natrinema halophilum]|uniref:Zinc-ribbon domain-containing protein n=1 Tax=Natrinema halophilum TaxID=1699371 RepID=A0A7D5K4V5_9EURY|nr:hypothetical protein [Natrinema halophilum]QLG47863.1 hypothetical protein HYG82_02890 [Natrinema halophilum]
MTGGSYTTTCNACSSEIGASARYCPNCGERQPWFTDGDGSLEEVYRREMIAEAEDGGLQIGDRAQVDPRVLGLLVIALGLATISLIAVGVTAL